MRIDGDDAALLEEVLAGPRRALVPLPDLRVIERPGWLQLVTPSFRTGGFNEVSLSVLDDGEADAVIDATIAEYRRLGLAFRWAVPPGSKPDDLSERLARRGLARSTVRGMARTTADPPDGSIDGVRVDEVDETSLDLFTRVMAEGWATDRSALDAAHNAIFRQPERNQRLYLAFRGGEPAAVASYVVYPRSAYLLGGVVLPRFRGLGLYRALVGARLRDASARGIQLATSQAREGTSAPILERMGFRTICQFPVFHG
ncbi:MAG TPA: GNAT family N-acetyltransferase [Kofleriaceae bacterium]|nr:GNAT family N-acetyltransferase [Kofleriaceae bacterium]